MKRTTRPLKGIVGAVSKPKPHTVMVQTRKGDTIGLSRAELHESFLQKKDNRKKMARNKARKAEKQDARRRAGVARGSRAR